MPRINSGTPWQQFKLKWQDCSLCSYCETRKNIVLCRGQIPCHVLFVGEAPGASEDVLAQPFVGPAGKLLDRQIETALWNSGKVGITQDEIGQEVQYCDLRIAFTNLVCCIPKDRKGGNKIGEPSKEAIEACATRLDEFIELCKPDLIVLVGDLAKKNAPGWNFGETISVTHPAAILRADIVKQELMNQRVIVALENAFREL